MGFSLGQIDENTMECIKMIKRKGLGHLNNRMEGNTQESGMMESSMEMEHMWTLMDNQKRRMDKWKNN